MPPMAQILESKMKKFLVRTLVVTLLSGALPVFADDDGGDSGGGGGGGGGGSGAAVGIAIGGVAIAGLIGYLIYRSNKEKEVGLPKAEDPFAPQPNEMPATYSSPQGASESSVGGFGSNQKHEF